jgi:ribosome-associated heat shock protein Hsp15
LRLDLFLRTSRLVRQRALAKKVCDAGVVEVDGQKAKPGRMVKEGQSIRIHSPTRLLEVRIVKIPKGNVSKADASTLYEVVRAETRQWI